MDGFEELSARAPTTVAVDGVEIGRGSRVVLRPGEGGDIFDTAIAGKLAVVDAILEDMEGGIQVAVVVEDDPGRDMGERRQPGHRFFFSLADVEPLAGQPPPTRRVLVAGIGNIFMADDGFGVEVAKRLEARELPPGVDVGDFGIRGLDLVYALGEGYDAAVFVDAVPRGEEPGTLFVIEPELHEEDAPVMLDAHGMDPVKVLALARQLGAAPERILVVGCEPAVRMTGEEEDVVGDLSPPVSAAIDEAVELVESVVADLLKSDEGDEGGRS